ncbi:MAG: hypothetical protein HQL31_02290, partial [Planctomycetes bacterium]|nr:hypothetical protein [Planctomycetota bacterium]
MRITTLLISLLCIASTLTAETSLQIPYSGQLLSGGNAISGNALMKFALHGGGAGNIAVWRNDGLGSGSPVAEPTVAVDVSIDDGVFTAMLGDDSLVNMAALPSNVFDGGNIYFKVWVSHDSPYEELSPDKPMTAVPYAYYALNGGAGSVFSSTNGNAWLQSGMLGVGTATPQANLHVLGNAFVSNGLSASSLISSGYVYASSMLVLKELASAPVGTAGNGELYALSDGNIYFKSGAGPAFDLKAGNAWMQNGMVTYLGSGNLAIGTSTPTADLHIANASLTQLRVESSSDEVYAILDSATGYNSKLRFDESGTSRWSLYRDATDGNKLKIYNYTLGNSALAIDAAGMVGIGTSNPLQRLDISGNVGLSSSLILSELSTAPPLLSGNGQIYVKNDSNLYFKDSSGTEVNLLSGGNSPWGVNGSNPVLVSGNVGIGTTSPQAKLHVVGNIMMVDGNQANGYVMVSDSNGVASWVHPTTLDDGDWSAGIGTGNVWVSSGRIGIITAAPQANLHIAGNFILADGTQSANYVLASDSNGLGSWTDVSTLVPASSWATVNGNITVGSGNNVGIGTTVPSNTLHVVGNAFISSGLRIDGLLDIGGN